MTSGTTWYERARELKGIIERLNVNKALKAWICYQSGDVKAATKYWEKAAHVDDDKGLLAMRSLAVHYHSQAYDEEVAGRHRQAQENWQKALTYWGRLFQSSSFRTNVIELSEVKDGKALDCGREDEMIDALCLSVLAPNATLAYQRLESKNEDQASDHMTLIRDATFSDKSRQTVIDDLLNKICPFFYDEIDHTTYTESTAFPLERRGHFILKHYPESINGLLAILVTACWFGKEASETSENIDAAWEKIKDLREGRILARTEAWIRETKNMKLQNLADMRLKDIAEVACDIELTKINCLANDCSEAKSPVQLMNALEQMTHHNRKEAVEFCEWLGKRYGASTKADLVRKIFQGRYDEASSIRRRLDI